MTDLDCVRAYTILYDFYIQYLGLFNDIHIFTRQALVQMIMKRFSLTSKKCKKTKRKRFAEVEKLSR